MVCHGIGNGSAGAKSAAADLAVSGREKVKVKG